MDISICTLEDYDNIVKLWQNAGLPYKPKGRDSRDNIEKQLNMDNIIFLKATIDSQMAAVIVGSHDGRKGWINRLAVSPKHRNKGLGRVMVEHAEKYLRDSGMEIIVCLIEGDNTPSLNLFQKLGYNIVENIVYLSKKDHPEV